METQAEVAQVGGEMLERVTRTMIELAGVPSASGK